MRNLDAANASIKSTKHVFIVSLIIPFGMGFGAWALAEGAAPAIPLRENYLAILALCIIALTVLSLPVPYIFRWNWETKYFGAGLLVFGSGSIIGIYPILCIAQYSSLPFLIRACIVISDGMLIVWWCARFVEIYRRIYANKKIFCYIYTEEATAVYFLQQAEKNVIEKIFRLNQFPGAKLTTIPMALALLTTPFAPSVSKITGIPFIHIFLAVSMLPVTLMFLGLSTRAWLIFYYYPAKIKKETNKPVYIDKSSPAPKQVNLTP